MNQAAPEVRDLARFLLAIEKNQGKHGEVYEVQKVLEKLRLELSKLVGAAGFQALMSRALALVKPGTAWLKVVGVQENGSLEGFRETAMQQSAETVAEGSEALLTQLFELLVTFIGEAMTQRLVMDVWPELRLDSIDSGAEEKLA